MSQTLKTISIHVLFWLLYVASEYFANMMHMQPGHHWRFFQATFLSLPPMIVATYFIAFFVVPRYLKTNRWPWFILWVLIVMAFVFYARIKWTELINYLESGRYFKMPIDKMLKNIIRDYSIIALAVCIYIIGDYRKKQKLNEQLIKAKAEVEIKLLKGQLHPHFLFNSLNNIYSLALMKSDLTADSILKLTELLDYLVYRANMDKVALSKEVELLQNYVDLEKLRYGEKLRVESDIEIQNDAIQLAPLILLPFAENCFKHGGPGKDGVFRIKIQLRADQKRLVFEITNSKKRLASPPFDFAQGKLNSGQASSATGASKGLGHGPSTLRQAQRDAGSGAASGSGTGLNNGGVGLENIRKRLTLLYPKRHSLNIEDSLESYRVKLEIDF